MRQIISKSNVSVVKSVDLPLADLVLAKNRFSLVSPPAAVLLVSVSPSFPRAEFFVRLSCF